MKMITSIANHNAFNLALLSSVFMAFACQAHTKEVEVEMKSLSFSPKLVALVPGDSVVWKNTSYTDHSATGEKFDTGLVHPKDKSKPVVFNELGPYAYHCQIHGKIMSGTVQVNAK